MLAAPPLDDTVVVVVIDLPLKLSIWISCCRSSPLLSPPPSKCLFGWGFFFVMLLEMVSSDDDDVVVVVAGIGVSCLLQSCMNDLDYIGDITRKHITKFSEREVREQEIGMGWDGMGEEKGG